MRRRGERGVSGKTRRGAGNSAPLPLRRGREQPLRGGRREGMVRGDGTPAPKFGETFPWFGAGAAPYPRAPTEGRERPQGRLCPPFPVPAHLGSPSLAPSVPRPRSLRPADKAGLATPRGQPGSPCWISGAAAFREVCPVFPPLPAARPRVWWLRTGPHKWQHTQPGALRELRCRPCPPALPSSRRLSCPPINPVQRGQKLKYDPALLPPIPLPAARASHPPAKAERNKNKSC